MKKILFFLIILISCYLILLYLFQRKLIYFPNPERPKLADHNATDMRVVDIKSCDGLILSSWYKEPISKEKPVVLYLHGNGGHIGYRMPIARQILNRGYGLLLLEYRGYGGNKGYPFEKGLYCDARSAIHYLNEIGIPSNQIILYGESLGTAVATELAVDNESQCLILQSPFSSLSSVAKYHYPWLPLKPKDKFDSLSRITNIKLPLLILQGDKDKVVPIEEAKALFQKANSPKEFIIFPNKGHDDLWNGDFYEKLFSFIEKYCVTSNL